MATPRITVLMAVADGERYLPDVIDSLRTQDFTDFELLVVDDASVDSTPELLRSASAGDRRIRVLVNDRRQGLTAALNTGLRQARGDYVARIDADDRCHPDRLSRQLAVMERERDLVVIAGGYRIIDGEGRVLGHVRDPLDDWQARWLCGFSPVAPHPTYFFRRCLPDGNPVLYEESYRTAQDFDLWTRLSEYGRVAVLGDCLIDYRRHSDGISATRRQDQLRNGYAIGRRMLSRRLPEDAMQSVEPLLGMLGGRLSARGDRVREAVGACDALLRHDLPRAPSPAHRRWMKRVAAGLLADAVLARGGALARPGDAVRFLWHARSLLPDLLALSASRPATVRKVVSAAWPAPRLQA